MSRNYKQTNSFVNNWTLWISTNWLGQVCCDEWRFEGDETSKFSAWGGFGIKPGMGLGSPLD